jgi:hypothetical protein
MHRLSLSSSPLYNKENKNIVSFEPVHLDLFCSLNSKQLFKYEPLSSSFASSCLSQLGHLRERQQQQQQQQRKRAIDPCTLLDDPNATDGFTFAFFARGELCLESLITRSYLFSRGVSLKCNF